MKTTTMKMMMMMMMAMMMMAMMMMARLMSRKKRLKVKVTMVRRMTMMMIRPHKERIYMASIVERVFRFDIIFIYFQ